MHVSRLLRTFLSIAPLIATLTSTAGYAAAPATPPPAPAGTPAAPSANILPTPPPPTPAKLPPVDIRTPWAPATDEAAVVRELRDNTLAGVSRRLGPSYDDYHPGQKEKFPELYLAPVKKDPGGRQYEIGGPWTKAGGDFSSTQGQVIYVADNPATFPVDRVTILEWTNGTFSEKPEPPWHGGFRPEPASKKWLAVAPQGNAGFPIATIRGGSGTWANCGLTVFSSGLIASGGTVTGHGTECATQLPPNKIPTAISITNKSEFALVTVFDTTAHKGQVAVLSLQVNGKKMRFVHEWQDDSWSLPSVGLFTDLKILGYIDIPGMKFPTSVCAVGDREGGRMNGRDGNAGLLREYDLSKQADRDVFLKGSNAGYSSASGWAVVASKYENKAAFIDLQPLFQKIREMYFGTEENFQKTRDNGPDPKQWPQTFDADPSWKPAVVAVIDVPHPTAVLATLSGGTKNARAFIASLDGKIGMYAVGGLASLDPAQPKDIVRISELQAGRNPTCLTYQKHSHEKFLVCSRGDREIEWVTYWPKGAKEPTKTMEITNRLRDARLLDPVNIEVADTHGVSTSLFSVTDFKGRQLLNYRYSTCTFATQGGAKFDMGPDGKDAFECGGILDFPGSPFGVSAGNVN